MRRFLQVFCLLIIGAQAGEFRVLEGHERWVLALAISPDGKRLASGSDDHTLRLWDLQGEGGGRVLRRFESAVSAIAFSRDGSKLIVGTWDGELFLCDAESGKTLREYPEHTETVNALAFEPSGEYFASGSADDRLIVWDVVTGEDLMTMHQGNEYDVTTLAFSLDGERMVTGDGENQLKVWDASTGEELETLTGHSEPVTCALFNRKGRIISGGWDDSVRIQTSGEDLVLKGHRGDITGLALSGNTLISASEDKTIRVWDAESGEWQRTLEGHTESISCLVVSADGKRVYSGSKQVIHAWELKSKTK